jgi:hypothetical protein
MGGRARGSEKGGSAPLRGGRARGSDPTRCRGSRWVQRRAEAVGGRRTVRILCLHKRLPLELVTFLYQIYVITC